MAWEILEQRETGNRMIGWGAHFQVSGLGHRDPGPGDQVQVAGNLPFVLDSVLPPLRVAGGSPRWQVAGVPPSVIDSVICHLSSTLSSIHFGWPVAAPGGGWRRFSIQPSTQSSTQPSTQSSVIDSALPRQTRAARGAAPTSSQCPEITKNDEPRTRNSPDQHPL